MFETFGLPCLYLAVQEVLALYGSGRTTGLVLDIGHSTSHAVPIFESSALSPQIIRNHVAGTDLTEYLRKMMLTSDPSSNWTSYRDIPNDIKEKICYIALDYEDELTQYQDSNQEFKNYELPDGQEIVIRDQIFRCPEILFRPSLAGKSLYGIGDMVYDAISRSDVDLRRDLYSNIVLSGGSTLFPGFADRLKT